MKIRIYVGLIIVFQFLNTTRGSAGIFFSSEAKLSKEKTHLVSIENDNKEILEMISFLEKNRVFRVYGDFFEKNIENYLNQLEKIQRNNNELVVSELETAGAKIKFREERINNLELQLSIQELKKELKVLLPVKNRFQALDKIYSNQTSCSLNDTKQGNRTEKEHTLAQEEPTREGNHMTIKYFKNVLMGLFSDIDFMEEAEGFSKPRTCRKCEWFGSTHHPTHLKADAS